MRNLRSLIFLTFLTLGAFVTPKAEAQLLNPCCQPVPVCCGPVIVRRPIIRNAAAELRMAVNYHLNYRFYRGVVYGSPVITHHHHAATPTPAESHASEKPYLDESDGPSDSVLQPVQPATPLQPVEPQPLPTGDSPQEEPDLDAEPRQPQAAPADKPVETPANEDTFQIEQPTTATIVVTVPKNATVTINGKPTTSVGPTRTFISRNLDPTARYRFNIEVSWIAGPSNFKVAETIELAAGGTIAKSFSTPDAPIAVKK